MKKALVVFLALAMIAGVFADEPVAESSIAGFSGNASVTWGVDLDSKKTGFSNDASAELKVTLATGGDKTSAGDGVWGEIKIKTDGLISKNDGWDKNGSASVDFAKLHL
ncbi:MAG: autotransporter, partial [Clostridiaceae bacterium]|nr:autotransporter [Clostridiaceae bacterium]